MAPTAGLKAHTERTELSQINPQNLAQGSSKDSGGSEAVPAITYDQIHKATSGTEDCHGSSAYLEGKCTLTASLASLGAAEESKHRP